MEHATGVAQTARAFATQGMRIDARHLRRDVGTKTHLATRLRVNNLEGTQVEILASPCQQRLQVFDMRGDDELIAPALEQIQHLTARHFNAGCLWWKYFFDAIWQEPAVYRCHYAIPL